MMAIVPSADTQRIFRPNPVITLEEYARMIGYDECSFFGITNGPDHTQYECDDYWSLDQRNYLLHFLSEAQQEIEDEIQYFLSADWTVGDIESERDSLYRYVDQQKPAGHNTRDSWHKNFGIYRSRWRKVNTIGTRAVSTIAASSVINYATEPAVVGPIATTVTDVSEIHIYHPGSQLEINPSEIVISGGNVTISIPRCRLKAESLLDELVEYSDIGNFEVSVDVRRVYTDPTIQGVLLCSSCGNCTNTELSGCLRILNQKQGTIEFVKNNQTCVCGCIPSRIGFSYYSGDINVTQKSKDVVVRLAHSKMSEKMCGCDYALRLWRRDREIPEIITKDSKTQFGISYGAQIAAQFVKSMKSFSFGEL